MDVDTTARRLLLLACAAFALGVLASLSVGFVRTFFLAALVSAAGTAVLVLERSPGAAQRPLGGSGYELRPVPWVRWLHVVSIVMYCIGIMVVVFAAMVRVGMLDVQVAAGTVQVFPLYVGAYLVILGTAADQHIRRRGGVVRGWSTRIHAGLVGVVVAGALAAAGILAFAGSGPLLRPEDLPVLALVAALVAGTHILLASGLPSSVDLVIQLAERKQVDEGPPTHTPPIVYALVLATVLAMVASFLASQLDLFERIGRFRDDRVVYVIAVVPLAFVLFFATSAFALWRESRRGVYRKRMPVQLRNDLLVYGSSALAGLVCFLGLAMVLSGRIESVPWLGGGRDLAKDLTMLTILVTTGPIGWYLHRQHRRLDAIEMRLPDLLNDLAESRRAGLTLAASLRVAASTDYGPLTAEVRKMANQVGWGISFNEAFQQFSRRVNTGLVKRTAHLIIEASHTGGSISEILKAAARDAFELKSLESERRITMMTYLIVIYVVFFVFMVVLASLDAQFIPAVIEAQEKVAGSNIEGGLGSGGAQLDPDQIRFIYFNAAMVQAIGNGIVGGVLGEGRVTAGFRHVAVMAFSGWFVFRLLLAAV